MNILVARTAREIETAYQKLSRAKVLGCDTETSSLSARHGKIFSVQFSDGDFNVLIPLSENVSMGRLEEILTDPQITKIFHNARFDLEFLREKGFETNNIFCTMIAEKLLTKGAGQSCSLAETLYRYFAVDLDKSQRAKFNRNWNGIWTDDLVNYALSDVIYLPELQSQQILWLERLGLTEDFHKQMKRIF
ncbi:MAG: ribonuclease D [Pyrinomonadaceae bacterium]